MPNPTAKSALLIAGPTASGKSALALALARERNGVIINADAMQVYRQLRIVTARPSPVEEAQAPHRLYGHVSGAESYSVARWLEDARMAMEQCWLEGRLPIVCGGTGLYFKALEQGLAAVPPIADAVREKWRNFPGDPYMELRLRDREAADRIKATDRQRVVRALEVVDSTGFPLSWWQAREHDGAVLKGVSVERRFLAVPRDELYARAERRFDSMLEQGALEEVRALPPLDPSMPLMKAIGVPELLAHLRGEITLDEVRQTAKTATRNYIKRQLTWWRGQGKDWL